MLKAKLISFPKISTVQFLDILDLEGRHLGHVTLDTGPHEPKVAGDLSELINSVADKKEQNQLVKDGLIYTKLAALVSKDEIDVH